jgi:hypothetical protein
MNFGDLPIRPEEVVRRLCSQVEHKARSFGGDLKNNATPWTRAIKEILEQLVCEHHGRALFTQTGVPREAGTGEFLLDFEWWEQDETKAFRRAIMGAESEWASWYSPQKAITALAYDFRKLLCFKAPLKLLVFDRPNGLSRKVVHDMLCSHLQKFQQHAKGECYLFVEFWPEKWNGHFYNCGGHIFRADQDGPAASVVLSPVLLDGQRYATAGGP